MKIEVKEAKWERRKRRERRTKGITILSSPETCSPGEVDLVFSGN